MRWLNPKVLLVTARHRHDGSNCSLALYTHLHTPHGRSLARPRAYAVGTVMTVPYGADGAVGSRQGCHKIATTGGGATEPSESSIRQRSLRIGRLWGRTASRKWR